MVKTIRTHSSHRIRIVNIYGIKEAQTLIFYIIGSYFRGTEMVKTIRTHSSHRIRIVNIYGIKEAKTLICEN